jgi:RNA 2',3'-cyclic 3'-phosphodiesterase
MSPKDRPKSSRLRLFVALELPDQFLDALVSWREEAFAERRDLRLPSRYSLHVTLVFLGYQYERDVEKIADASFADGGAPFELKANDVSEVPPRRPRLYAVGLDDADEKLIAWQGNLAERLQAGGFYEPEKRPFWPHITIARFKQTERHRTGGGARGAGRGRGPVTQPEPMPELPDELREPFEAARLTLYKSTLRPQGAEYEPLARVELGGAEPAGSEGAKSGAEKSESEPPASS